jgi:hypothetical protein
MHHDDAPKQSYQAQATGTKTPLTLYICLTMSTAFFVGLLFSIALTHKTHPLEHV